MPAEEVPSPTLPAETTQPDNVTKNGLNQSLLAVGDINQSIMEAGKKIFDFINNLQSGTHNANNTYFKLGRPEKFNLADMRFEASINGRTANYSADDIRTYLASGNEVIFASRAQAVLLIRTSPDIPKSKIKHLQHGRPVSIAAN
jgi:hypothetical protein